MRNLFLSIIALAKSRMAMADNYHCNYFVSKTVSTIHVCYSSFLPLIKYIDHQRLEAYSLASLTTL
jgi:hypothetical protein